MNVHVPDYLVGVGQISDKGPSSGIRRNYNGSWVWIDFNIQIIECMLLPHLV